MKKPYHQIPIVECGEPLVPIPLEEFGVELPHPYQKLGAPYREASPYYLRQTVLTGLITAQNYLQQRYPGWRIQIFDAYRPVAVQQFMVDYTFAQVIQARNLHLDSLSELQQAEIWQEVYHIWAVPSSNPMTPPPHTTGAAIDVTLIDTTDYPIDMGSPIDELSPRSHPDYYVNWSDQPYHTNRLLLHSVMLAAGFRRNPKEWWHFSMGDQMWAWLWNQENSDQKVTARYGICDGDICNI